MEAANERTYGPPGPPGSGLHLLKKEQLFYLGLACSEIRFIIETVSPYCEEAMQHIVCVGSSLVEVLIVRVMMQMTFGLRDHGWNLTHKLPTHSSQATLHQTISQRWRDYCSCRQCLPRLVLRMVGLLLCCL